MKAFFLLFLSLSFSTHSLGENSSFFLDSVSEVIFPPAEVRLLAFGDLMLGRDIARQMEEKGKDYPFEKIFGKEGIDPDEFDLVTANLEGPIVEARKRADLFPQFAFDPEIVPSLLQSYGFDLVNVANNHSWDHGAKGWESTLTALDSVGIAHVGHPKNWFDYDLYETEKNGLRLGVIGITDMLFPVDWEEAKKKVKELKQRNDFIILMIHWGTEYQTVSNLHQQDKAHGMIDAGVDMIIGHHPHVVQEHEYYKGKPIYYSLGNFVFDQYFSEEAQKGLGLDIVLKENGEIDIQEIPIVLDMGQPSLPEPEGENQEKLS